MALEQWEYDDFLPQFASVLRNCAINQLGFKRKDVRARLATVARLNWSDNQLTNFWSPTRRGGKVNLENLPSVSWAHGTAPYLAGRMVERRHAKEESLKDILPLDPDSFVPGQLQHFLPARAHHPAISHPVDFTKSELCEVSMMEFKSGQHTGEHPHDMPGHIEVVYGLRGEGCMEFLFPDGGTQKHDISPKKHLIFDAGVRHRAYLTKGTSAAFLVVTFKVPRDSAPDRLSRLKDEWEESPPHVRDQFLAWLQKENSN